MVNQTHKTFCLSVCSKLRKYLVFFIFYLFYFILFKHTIGEEYMSFYNYLSIYYASFPSTFLYSNPHKIKNHGLFEQSEEQKDY